MMEGLAPANCSLMAPPYTDMNGRKHTHTKTHKTTCVHTHINVIIFFKKLDTCYIKMFKTRMVIIIVFKVLAGKILLLFFFRSNYWFGGSEQFGGAWTVK